MYMLYVICFNREDIPEKVLKRSTYKNKLQSFKCELRVLFVNSIEYFVNNMILPDLNMDDDKAMHSYKSAYFGWIF